MPGQGENAAFKRSPNEGPAAVDRELRAINPQVSQSEDHRLAGNALVERCRQGVQGRVEFIPQRCIRTYGSSE
jgi:hypothetical protein